MLASSALISYSRALTNAETSSSPFLFKALSDVWERIVRAEKTLTRLALRLGYVACILEIGSLRLRLGFDEGVGAILGSSCCKLLRWVD